MKIMKRALALMLAVMFVVLCFAGCSGSKKSAEITNQEDITKETMLIAYTEENAPFIYTDKETGKLEGFDVEVFRTIFDDIKNEWKTFMFVKVDENYRLGEDVYYTDANGEDCIAYVMIGGVQKNVGDVNETYTFTDDVINNRVITITRADGAVAGYNELNGRNVGVISGVAKTALDNHSTIKNNCKSVTEYKQSDIKKASEDLSKGKIQALVIDEFTFNKLDGKDSFKTLDGELDNISYVYCVKKWDWYKDPINNAIYELQSPDYNDADEFTPIVEKYFGYDASSFDYTPKETK